MKVTISESENNYFWTMIPANKNCQPCQEVSEDFYERYCYVMDLFNDLQDELEDLHKSWSMKG